MADDSHSEQRDTAFAEEWTAFVEPAHHARLSMMGHCVTYGSTAIQAAYILNGGALASIPLLSSIITNKTDLLHAAVMFVAGIAFAAICSFSAYVNFLFLSYAATLEAEDAGDAIAARYGIARPIVDRTFKRKHFQHMIKTTQIIAVVSSILTITMFVIGCYRFMGAIPRL